MSIDFVCNENAKYLNDCLTIIPLYSDNELPEFLNDLKLTNQQINVLNEIKSNLKTTETFFNFYNNSPVMIVFIKNTIKSSNQCLEIGKIILSCIKKFSYKKIQFIGSKIFTKNKEIFYLREIVFSINTSLYEFKNYKTDKKENSEKFDGEITIVTSFKKELEKKIIIDNFINTGITTVRNLCSEPSNILTPEKFVETVKELSALGIKIEILNEKEMEKLGMNALLCVGRGSPKASYMAVMKWEGGKKSEKPLVFIGKGVCFDTGGISIKPSLNMEQMKSDMAGAAIVTGTMQSIALQKLNKNIIGVIGLVENMPDGKAIKPGDIIRSMSGKTIEILNTDAEGRLVLADALYYANKYLKPKAIIDLATLTGAIIIALGNERAGLFSNNDKLSENILSSSEKTNELVWRLPLGEKYSEKMKSKIADLQNIGTRGGSSIQAACFLENFVGSTPWAHLDIAGVMDMKAVSNCWGVKLLDDIAKNIKI